MRGTARERKTMRKLFAATAVCAVAAGLTVAPGAVGKAQTKQVASTVTVSASPTAIEPTTTAVSATGNVFANSSCRKNRSVSFEYVSGTGVVTPTGVTVTTRPNGDYTATLPPPPTTADGTTVVRATVAQTLRTKAIKGKNKGADKGKKKGKSQKRKFNCLEGVGTSSSLTVSDGLP
jgi:hypothetical protein